MTSAADERFEVMERRVTECAGLLSMTYRRHVSMYNILLFIYLFLNNVYVKKRR